MLTALDALNPTAVLFIKDDKLATFTGITGIAALVLQFEGIAEDEEKRPDEDQCNDMFHVCYRTHRQKIVNSLVAYS